MEGYRLGQLLYHSSSTAVSVYEALSPQGEPVVIKTYEKACAEEANEQVTEALLQMRVEHSNTCRLIDLQMTTLSDRAIRVHLIMERLERDLKKDIVMRTNEQRPYTDSDLLAIVQQIGSALVYAKSKVTASQNIAHRDIKPENIFIDSAETYKIGDFGCAWQKKQQEITTNPVGTMVYLSPELRQAFMTVGKPYNPFRSDVYSFGVTILHAALMRVPEELRTGERLETATEQVLSRLNYSDKVKSLLRKMLIVDENQRASIEEVVLLAEESLDSEPSVSESAPEDSPVVEETKSPASPAKTIVRGSVRPLLVLRDRYFYFYDIVTEQWKKRIPLRMPINFNGDSVSTFLKDNRIFACAGGTKPRKIQTDTHTYIINFSGMVRKEAAMTCSRRSPGIFQVTDSIFLFGGGFSGHGKSYIGEPYRSAECFSMNTGQWTELPSMNAARLSFNPCQHAALLYLCGGGVTSVETFDPSSRRFALLGDLVLPDMVKFGCACAVVEDVVVVYGMLGVYKWSVTRRKEVASAAHDRLFAWSNCTPLLHEDRIYIYSLGESCLLVANTDSGALLRQLSLKN